MKVTPAKPALKLAVSAKSVKPDKTVTVTATLGAPHANRTLTIYAQTKGGAKKLMKRATINSKGQLSVVYTIKANTTFTVTFSGDTWYTSASATAAVKSLSHRQVLATSNSEDGHHLPQVMAVFCVALACLL